MCMLEGVCVCMEADAQGGWQRVLDALDLESQVVVSCPAWVQETELRSSVQYMLQ